MLVLVLLETAVDIDSIFIHAVIYLVLGIVILYLLLQKSYKPKAPVVLTASVSFSNTQIFSTKDNFFLIFQILKGNSRMY